ncbi:hypothetical protein HA402_008218 [Bradysia odoriphaga]|nr:hypothetical protein HA402_008218 [Bradysia odoriphaga]
MCPIQLMSIKIWPEVGSLKSTGIDIFTTINGRSEKIAICNDLTMSENNVVFCRLDNSSDQGLPQSKKCFFFRNFRANAKIDKFTIRIWKTRNSSVPAIKKIEVWGKVTHKSALNEQVLNLWRSRDAGFQNPDHSTPHQSNTTNTSHQPTRSNEASNQIEIPDELCDAITHQIMTVPMTLPSGKTVDQSTIEKFNKIEATWGREPSDPFTGLAFTNNRKPIFNSALKSSIDILMTKYPNASQLSDVPRTVGGIGCANGKRFVESIEMSSSDNGKRQKYFEHSLNGIDVSGPAKYLCRATTEEANKISCYQCQSTDELYRIKICGKDFICRNCLFKIDFNECDGECRCHRLFSRTDVERYYSSRTSFNYSLS